MSALARTAAAVAGSLASAAAVAVAIILPVHHTPAGNGLKVTAGTAAITRGSGGSGQSSAGAGSTRAGGGSSGSGGSGSGGSDSAGTGSGGTGSSGPGSNGGSSAGEHAVHPIVAALPHLPMTLVTTIPSPTGTIGGPNAPCLQGYVWRQAYAGDYVCVTPDARAAAAYDNSQAATTYTGFPGGALYAQSPIGDCSGVPGTTDNEYVIAYDSGSGRWSNKLPINSDCASF